MAILIAGCGSEQDNSNDAPAAAKARPSNTSVATESVVSDRVLNIPDIKQLMPNTENLPGWKMISRRATKNRILCDGVFANSCKGTVGLGYSDFTHGKATPEKFARISFNVYSCRNELAAKKLYGELPLDVGKLITGPEGIGDQQAAAQGKAGEVTTVQSKVRVNNTVIWVYVTGSEQTATVERLDAGVRLLYERVRQAKQGITPIVSEPFPTSL
ncbi:hypothetical protein [Streptomyces sp. CC219B]|uniref:hypothetical protein n=1 Tax=Streptomyces sp. CC219B TaxID=3044574 RepID=UPI0024A7F639|nr:hypothetical protein [Streptomyces sp. CC219B]